MYYRGAQSAVLVYDISSMSSFESVLAWVTELHNALEDDIRTSPSSSSIFALMGHRSSISLQSCPL